MKKTDSFNEFVHPLDMNGLSGRMALLPAPAGSSLHILFIYDRRSSLEQWESLIRLLNRYGSVTAPDLPGLGGMESFYRIGRTPDIDTFADYLAAIVRLRFRRKQLVIVGVGFGLIVATRMIQRYPALAEHVRFIVGIGGHVRYDDKANGVWANRRTWLLAKVSSYTVPALVLRHAYLNRRVLGALAARRFDVMTINDSQTRAARINTDVDMMRLNDYRTLARTTAELLVFDNCLARIEAPLWYVQLEDTGLDAHKTVEHLRVTFRQLHVVEVAEMLKPGQAIDDKLAQRLIPAAVRRALRRLSTPTSSN